MLDARDGTRLGTVHNLPDEVAALVLGVDALPPAARAVLVASLLAPPPRP